MRSYQIHLCTNINGKYEQRFSEKFKCINIQSDINIIRADKLNQLLEQYFEMSVTLEISSVGRHLSCRVYFCLVLEANQKSKCSVKQILYRPHQDTT